MEGHAFISYVREDKAAVDRIQRVLEAVGVRVWRDTEDLWPGDDWRLRIRQAIESESLVFLACFSETSVRKAKTYQNEELRLAVDQLRLRHPSQPWLIPIRLTDCELPPFDLGAGRTLDTLHRVDLFGDHWDAGTGRLVMGVHRILSSTDQQPLPPPIGPLYIAGGIARDPTELGRVLSDNWQAARNTLADDSDNLTRLRTWLTDHDQARPLRILDEPGRPERRLVRLIFALDPGLPLRYQTLEVSPESLKHLAQQAIDGDRQATRTVCDLFVFDVLGNHPAFAETNARWRSSMSVLDGALQQTPVDRRQDALVTGFSVTLLGCVAGHEALAPLRADVVMEKALTVDWFHHVIQRLGGEDPEQSVGVEAVKVVLGPIATRVAVTAEVDCDPPARQGGWWPGRIARGRR